MFKENYNKEKIEIKIFYKMVNMNNYQLKMLLQINIKIKLILKIIDNNNKNYRTNNLIKLINFKVIINNYHNMIIIFN